MWLVYVFSTWKFGIHGNKQMRLAILHPLTQIEISRSFFIQ